MSKTVLSEPLELSDPWLAARQRMDEEVERENAKSAQNWIDSYNAMIEFNQSEQGRIHRHDAYVDWLRQLPSDEAAAHLAKSQPP